MATTGGLRPPRRLRLLAFELEERERVRLTLVAMLERIEHTEERLARALARSSAEGRAPHPDAYRIVVKNEEQRQEVEEMLRNIEEQQRTLERYGAVGPNIRLPPGHCGHFIAWPRSLMQNGVPAGVVECPLDGAPIVAFVGPQPALRHQPIDHLCIDLPCA